MNVVKMELFVYNAFERAIVNEALNIIEAARAAQFTQQEAALAVDLAAAAGFQAAQGDAQAEESVAPPVPHAQVVGSITPNVSEMTAGGAPSRSEEAAMVAMVTVAEMEVVVQKSLDTRGLAETRELIAPLTGGKRWRESDPAVWPAIKAALA